MHDMEQLLQDDHEPQWPSSTTITCTWGIISFCNQIVLYLYINYFGALFCWIIMLAAKVFPSIFFTQLIDPKVGCDWKGVQWPISKSASHKQFSVHQQMAGPIYRLFDKWDTTYRHAVSNYASLKGMFSIGWILQTMEVWSPWWAL